MAAANYFETVQKIYIAFYQRPADPAGLAYWASRIDVADGDANAVIAEFANSAEATALYGTIDSTTIGNVIDALYMALFNRAPDAAGKQFYIDEFNAGKMGAGTIALNVLDGAVAIDKMAINHKLAVAKEFTQLVDGRSMTDPLFGTGTKFDATYAGDADAAAARDFLKGVTSNPATVLSTQQVTDAIKADIADAGDPILGSSGDQTLTLTHGADNITGSSGDDVFHAPVTQNGTGSGALANTFETGDVLDGGTGHNVLNADLIATGTVGGGGGRVAISATTKNIQEVHLRQQTPQSDWRVNNSTVDAEKMAGVEQWWTDNSRSSIQVEDIRTDTANTSFGMRLTDANVSFNNYFNALFLEGDKTATSAVTLNIYEGPAGAPDTVNQLKNISVREINFKIAGETVTLKSDAIKAADTWAELETALEDALAAIGVADTITVTNRGNGQFVFEDSAAREFQVNSGDALVLSVANNVTVTNSLAVGREEVVGPIVSSAMLDGAGNGGMGGALNIGAMAGQRGVQELDLSVDRDSHLRTITSENLVGPAGGKPNEFLEVVNLTSTGANGDLTVGVITNNLDGRVAAAAFSGFTNLREFNGADFAGDLNVAFQLTDNVDARYLKNATEPVVFKYTGGAQDDIFNIADNSAIGVSGDKDFAMQVNMGAGDDRLILDVATVSAVKVDGGTGENSIVVSQSHGNAAADTFAEFKNFQTYEVEGNAALTKHDFTSMSGVKNVVVATNGSVNTQLIDLEAAQNVTVSGKNQTTGNNSTADQNFGAITLTNDAGAARTVTLDNTARLANTENGVRQDGVLTVGALTIDTAPAAGVGATKTVTIESTGVRNTANAIASFNGRDVEKLNLTGTQDLTLNVVTMANQAGANKNTAMTVDGSALKGNLNLAVNGAMLDNNTVAPAQTDTFTGTAGAADTLMLHGGLNVASIKASGFETVQLGSWGGGASFAVKADGTPAGGSAVTMFGDLGMNATAAGSVNVAGLGVSKYILANLSGATTLEGLSSGSTVDLGDAARNDAGNRVAGQTVTQQINLVSSATKAANTVDSLTIHRLGNIASNTTSDINVGDSVAGIGAGVGGFKTINLVVDHAINQGANVSTVSNIDLDVGSQARTLNVTGGTSPTNIVGQADLLNLDAGGNELPNSLEKIDLSGFQGQVQLVMQQGAIVGTQTDVNFVLSQYNANVELSNGTGAINSISHNSVFDFTGAGSVQVPTQWTVGNVINAGAAGADVNNQTLFDVRDLGITNYAQLKILYVGLGDIVTDVYGNALGANDVVIRSESEHNNNAVTWEIVVDGLVALTGANAATQLHEANFGF